MKPICIPRCKDGVFYRASLEPTLLAHMAFLSGESRTPEPRSKLAEIKELIRKSEIEVEVDVLEGFRPEPGAELDIIFEKGGRAYAYYHFDKGPRRYHQRYRVDTGRPVVDAVFPVAHRNVH